MAFASYIKTITALTIFSTMACMFLPNNSFRKYLELVLGILILSAVIKPMAALFQIEDFLDLNLSQNIVVVDTLLEEEEYLIKEAERIERTTEKLEEIDTEEDILLLE